MVLYLKEIWIDKTHKIANLLTDMLLFLNFDNKCRKNTKGGIVLSTLSFNNPFLEFVHDFD